MTETKEQERYISWDTCEIARYRAEDLVEQSKEDGEELTFDEAFDQACGDSFLYDDEWEWLCDCLTEWMQELNTDGNWYASVENFGWLEKSGRKIIENVTTGSKLLQEILPRTECTFKIFHRGDHLEIHNAHHDSPIMGNEKYYIYPCKGE